MSNNGIPVLCPHGVDQSLRMIYNSDGQKIGEERGICIRCLSKEGDVLLPRGKDDQD